MVKRAALIAVGLTMFCAPFVVSAQAAPTITYVSNTGSSVTASYANLPANSTIVVINQTSGQPVSGISSTVSGSGTVTLTGLPLGTFYLEAKDSSGNYLAQSVSFTSTGIPNGGNTSALSCTNSIAGMTQAGYDSALWYAPASGPAPLTVQFATINTGGWFPGLSLDFGDGSTPLADTGFATLCSNPNPYITWTHTYAASGTYPFTMKYNGDNGLQLLQITVTNGTTAAPTISSFTASTYSISLGSATLSWNVSGATSLSIDNGVGAVTGSSVTVSPSHTTTYTLTATNSSGSVTAQTTVTVPGTGGGVGSCTYQGKQYNEGSTINLPLTAYDGPPGATIPATCDNGTWLVTPFGGTAPTVDACIYSSIPSGGGSVSAQGRSDIGCTAPLTISSRYEETATILPHRHGTVPFTISVTSAYICSNTGPGGVANCPYTITWGDGTSNLYSQYALWGTPPDTETHTYTAPGNYVLTEVRPSIAGTITNTANIRVDGAGGPTQQAPVISSFSASPSSIMIGQSVTLSWSVSNATTLSIDTGTSTAAITVTGSSFTVTPLQTTTYRLTATNSVGSVTTTTTVTVGGHITLPPPLSCVVFTANMSLGSTDATTGGQVSELQTFLIQYYASNPPAGLQPLSVTGFFGPITQSWVIQFQADHDLPQTGYVGPLTRGVIASVCGTPTGGSGGLSVSPSSGSAPLNVKFSGTVPGDHGFTLNFGDGSSPSITPALSVTCPANEMPCPLPKFQIVNQSHTYAANGTYTATLTSNGSTVGTALVTVGATSTTQSFTATPTSGNPPLAVSFSTGPLNANDTYNVAFGDGTTGPANSTTCNEIAGPGAACSYVASHTYASNGTYTATLYQSTNPLTGCQNGTCSGLAIGTVTITVGGGGTSSNRNFFASLTYGPAPVLVSFTATALDSNSTYAITYGDGNTDALPVSCITYNGAQSCFGSTSHTYQSAGTYTATLYQSNPNAPPGFAPNGVSCTNLQIPCLGQPIATIVITVVPGGNINQGESSFTASPTIYGAAPLTVTFQSNEGRTVTFGDGTSGALSAPAPSCVDAPDGTLFSNCYGSVQHTYSTPGIYMARLIDSSGNVIGTIEVTVTAACSDLQTNGCSSF